MADDLPSIFVNHSQSHTTSEEQIFAFQNRTHFLKRMSFRDGQIADINVFLFLFLFVAHAHAHAHGQSCPHERFCHTVREFYLVTSRLAVRWLPYLRSAIVRIPIVTMIV